MQKKRDFSLSLDELIVRKKKNKNYRNYWFYFFVYRSFFYYKGDFSLYSECNIIYWGDKRCLFAM
jgi:hypothetical protein